jgi:hypothetical protein
MKDITMDDVDVENGGLYEHMCTLHTNDECNEALITIVRFCIYSIYLCIQLKSFSVLIMMQDCFHHSDLLKERWCPNNLKVFSLIVR